jgi:hypothetical protein
MQRELSVSGSRSTGAATAWNSVRNSDIFRGRATLKLRIRVEYSGPWEGESYASEVIAHWTNEQQMFVNDTAKVT